MRIMKPLLAAILLLLVICVVGAAFLMRGGFRANATPSSAEALVARTVRNLSIPGEESRLKNPFEKNSDATRQGRVLFLNRCAVCHGPDGSAQTQAGLNLYPKAADLRAPATQNLTDGELHYIVQNGVRFTGMPALGNAHTQTSDDSWKFVLFIRSIGRLTGSEKSSPVVSAQYIGSQSCQKCHANIYERWKRTPMANVVRDPSEHPDAIIPDLSTPQSHPRNQNPEKGWDRSNKIPRWHYRSRAQRMFRHRVPATESKPALVAINDPCAVVIVRYGAALLHSSRKPLAG
jgi:mono/diheme cytochrome c family protein